MNFNYGKNSLLSVLCMISALFLLFIVQMNNDDLDDNSSQILMFITSFVLQAIGLVFAILSWKTAGGKAAIAASILSCLIIIALFPTIELADKADGNNVINLKFRSQSASKKKSRKVNRTY